MAGGIWGRRVGRDNAPPETAAFAGPCALRQYTARLEVEAGSCPVAIALDAGHLAQSPSLAAAAVEATVELLRLLPAEARLGVYFLGSRRPLSPEEFLVRGCAAIDGASGRVSLLQPVLRELRRTGSEDRQPARLVVLAAGPIFDLPDLIGTEALDPVVLCACGGADVRPEGCLSPLDVLPGCDPARILPLISPGRLGVSICAPGCVPFDWDNPRYRLVLDGELAVLRTEGVQSAAGLSVQLSLLGPADLATVTARTTHSDGRLTQRELPLAAITTGTDWSEAAELLGYLASEEIQAFRDICAGMRFICPVCGATHGPTEMVCRIQSPDGTPVFTCLQGADLRVFVFCEIDAQTVAVYGSDRSALRVGQDAVVHAGPPAAVLCFDAATGRWRATELRNYQQVGAVRVAVLG